MTEKFVISVDLDQLDKIPQGTLNLKTISCLGKIYINVSSSQFDSAIAFLRNNFDFMEIYCNVVSLSNLKDLVSLLDNGAAKLFVSQQQLRGIIQGKLIEDLGRLVLSVDSSVCEKDPAITVKDMQAQLRDIVGEVELAIHIDWVGNWKLLDMMQEYDKQPEGYPRRYASLPHTTLGDYVKAIEDSHIPVIPATALTAEPEIYTRTPSVSSLVVSILETDRPDGLYSTVVNNERGVCLGLVYSSKESMQKAIETRTGIYYSRSQKGLWHKGATSGDTQELIKIGWDCDGDALCFTVRQKGTGTFQVPEAFAFAAELL